MTASRHTTIRALSAMIADGVNSRPELERRLAMGKASVSRIVDTLIRERLVTEGAKLAGDSRGRKAASLDVRPDAAYMLGTDIEGLAMRACLLDARRQIVASGKRNIRRRGSMHRTLTNWGELIEDVMAQSRVPVEKIAGIGVGLPGVVDSDGFRTHTHLPPEGWVELNARGPLEKLGLPATAANNTLCVADFERRLGVARGCESFLLVLARYGLGAVMYGNGAFLVGSGMVACEFGHMRIGVKGPACVCGKRGCLDVAASGRTLPPKAQRRGPEWQVGLATRVEALGTGISNLLKLFHPSLVILDGIYNDYSEAVGAMLPEVLASELKGLCLSAPEVAFGEPVEFKASIGAALRAADMFLAQHLLATVLAPHKRTQGQRFAKAKGR